ncbi:MAG: hypothetical protein Q7T76_09850, partial [Ferruginibacter sp.]|nr:hypothetical protein [Ferruginibacter sp.]
MIATVLLLFLLLIFTIVFLTLLVKGKLGERKPLFILLLFFGFIILVFLFTGAEKVQADLSRFLRNTAPKDADKVYELLFKKSPASCVTFVNFKDQVVPKIDCCIWMEARLCPGELTRILALKKYERT